MKQKQKNWVFECLVDSDGDLVGLVAYAFYKKSKHDLAMALRIEGIDELEIQEKVKAHHDSVLRSPQLLENFKTEAKILLTEVHKRVREEVSSHLEREHASKIQELEVEKKKAYDNAVRKLKNSAKIFEEPSALRKSIGWLWNGFSGVFAAIITTVIVGGILFASSTDEEKKQVRENVVKSVVDQLSGE